eukprot:7877987-Pyramimonas_sp.AAC.1
MSLLQYVCCTTETAPHRMHSIYCTTWIAPPMLRHINTPHLLHRSTYTASQQLHNTYCTKAV